MAIVASMQQAAVVEQPTPMDALRDLCAGDLNQVNALILKHMQSEVGLIPQLAGHLVAAGGKRLRPLLTLASARLCGYGGAAHLGLAASVEFIHTATLLHDDVVDESALRRGQDTANAVWGNKPSVLVGDFLFSRAFELMVAAGSLRVLEILSKASAVIAEGEVQQLITANDTATDEDAYLSVIRAKTAALFAAACRIGAVVAERSAAEEAALDAFGLNIGIAYQLVDDCLDFTAHEVALGKAVGDDYRDGKVTLPVILAYARGDRMERAFWRRTVEELDQRDGDLERAMAMLDRTGALDDTRDRARGYAEAACDALAVFPDGPHRRVLLDVADFCVERAY